MEMVLSCWVYGFCWGSFTNKHTGLQPLKNDDLSIEQTRPKDGESFHQSVELITIQRTDHQKKHNQYINMIYGLSKHGEIPQFIFIIILPSIILEPGVRIHFNLKDPKGTWSMTATGMLNQPLCFSERTWLVLESHRCWGVAPWGTKCLDTTMWSQMHSLRLSVYGLHYCCFTKLHGDMG